MWRVGTWAAGNNRPKSGLAAAALLGSMLASAGPAWSGDAKVFRIGILTDAMVLWHTSTQGFRDGLHDLGYVEGKNVVFQARMTQGDARRVGDLAADLIRERPDLLLCVSDACRKENGHIPMVFVQVGDPIGRGLVRDIAHPEGNITGVANLRGELTAKRLELFKETVPSLRRVLVTYDPRENEEVASVRYAREAASKLGLVLLERPITAPLDIEPGLAELKEGGADGILIVQDGTNLNIPGRSLEVAVSDSLPTMYASSFWSQVGALASYGPDQYSQGRQAARLAKKILSGTPPSEIPVELPDLIEFVVNLKTAHRLGLDVSPRAVTAADRVIE